MRARPTIPPGFVLSALLALGCVTPVTETDLEAKLAEAAASVSGLGRTRIIPIYAETKLVAWALLTEARHDPSSPMSFQLGRRLALAANRRVSVVVGGPYPELSDQIVLNALSLNRDRPLRGLRLVFVSPEQPSPALAKAATQAQARLYHREYR